MLATPLDRASAHADAPDDARRLRAMVDDYWVPLGRILRSLGVREPDVDDALQQVYVTTASKIGVVQVGKERAFLVQVAVHVAARARRARGRSLESPASDIEEHSAAVPSAEDALERARALTLLDRVLDAFEEDLRVVFVLFEIEEMTMAEIAQSLGIAPGTVASRLRRAREAFERGVARLRSKKEVP